MLASRSYPDPLLQILRILLQILGNVRERGKLLRKALEQARRSLRAQSAIAEATSRTPVLMRPPFGVRWFGFREMQARLGLMGVMWSVIGLDWKLAAPRIAERVLSRAGDGAIICLHDGRGTLKDPDASSTIEAVRRIVPSLLARGYHFETVSQLLCRTRCQLTN